MTVMSVTQDTVSRETLHRLQAYHDLVLKWNPKINLISKSSVPNLWDRHIWDSTQVMGLTGTVGHWLDIGSGGGFPGLVLAICAVEKDPDRKVEMVESDQRKSAFLRTVIRELGLNASVSVKRVEEMPPAQADVISARALADLDRLLSFADRHLSTNGTAIFLKGEKWEKEVETARQSWSFQYKAHKSKTSSVAAILEIKEIQRV